MAWNLFGKKEPDPILQQPPKEKLKAPTPPPELRQQNQSRSSSSSLRSQYSNDDIVVGLENMYQLLLQINEKLDNVKSVNLTINAENNEKEHKKK